MKVSLIAVSSLDGFLTHGFDPNIYSWTSQEDQDFFFQKIDTAQLIIMGSKTYELAKHLMKHKKGRTRIVLTKSPEKYQEDAVSGMLDFFNESPKIFLQKYEKKGIKEAIVVGGSEINTLFLELGLVTDVYVTIEPFIFGSGKKLITKSFFAKLKLFSSKTLNTKGTLLLHYKIIS